MAKKTKAGKAWGWGVEFEAQDGRLYIKAWGSRAEARDDAKELRACFDARNVRGPIPLVERKEGMK